MQARQPMQRDGSRWTYAAELAPGVYHYAFVAEDGTTHHGAFDYAYLRHMPNMVVMAPKDENELQHMLKTALQYEGPASVRYPRGVSLGVPMDREQKELPIGKGELLRDGADVAIFAIGVSV